MTRQEYIDKMSPADREALEEYKKKNAEVTAANAKIENLNKLLKTAHDDTKAGNFDAAVKDMTDATAAKPDEPILWDTLGDAQLGLANAAAKAAHDNKTTDPSLDDKYAAADGLLPEGAQPECGVGEAESGPGRGGKQPAGAGAGQDQARRRRRIGGLRGGGQG